MQNASKTNGASVFCELSERTHVNSDLDNAASPLGEEADLFRLEHYRKQEENSSDGCKATSLKRRAMEICACACEKVNLQMNLLCLLFECVYIYIERERDSSLYIKNRMKSAGFIQLFTVKIGTRKQCLLLAGCSALKEKASRNMQPFSPMHRYGKNIKGTSPLFMPP